MATREQLIEDFADHKYATGEKFERLINSMKVVQEPVETPAASGTSLSFIDSIEQDKDGKITATKKTLDLSNAHELNPFKGWWKTGDTLPTSGFDGAYLYFKDTTQTPAVTTIYQWNGTAYANTGTVVDESNVQTFASGQAVNTVGIDNEPTAGSGNLVTSGGLSNKIVDVSKYTIGINGLPYYQGNLEGNNTIKKSGSATYKVIPVNGGEVITFKKGTGSSRFVFVKTFDYNPHLPYTLDLATGESVVVPLDSAIISKKSPLDAKFLLIGNTQSNGSSSLPEQIKLDGINLFENIGLNLGGIKKDEEKINIFLKGVSCLPIYNGNIESDGTIVKVQQSTYVVVPINGGETFIIKKGIGYTKFAISSSFIYNPIYPYTIDLATGEEVVTLSNDDTVTKTLPNDAKYIIISNTQSDGTNSLPSVLSINGHDILNGLQSSIQDSISSAIEAIEGLQQETEDLNQKFIGENTYNSLYETAGYWRTIESDNIRFDAVEGFAICLPIQIKVGDIIQTNSTIPGTSTAGHVLLAESGVDSQTIIQKVTLDNGIVEITQEMYNAGARYISLSFKLSDTPIPYVKVKRQLSIPNMQNQIDNMSVNQLSIIPIDSSNFNVAVKSGNTIKYIYHFTHYEKTWDSLEYTDGGGNTQIASNVKSADCWNNDSIYDGNGRYIAQGNTNFIFQVTGESKHCGDGHGLEVSLYTQFMADGIEINPTDSVRNCNNFRMIWKTKVYKTAGNSNALSTNDPALDTNGNPIVTAIHLLDAVISSEGILRINNSLTIKRNNIKFNQLHGAMLEMQYGDFDKVLINTDDKTINSVSSSGVTTAVGESVDLSAYPNNVANIVEMFGENVFIRQTLKPIRGVSIDNFVVHCEFYKDRLKNYFMPVGCNHYSTDAGVAVQTFNEGDVIAVECIREIEVL